MATKSTNLFIQKCSFEHLRFYPIYVYNFKNVILAFGLLDQIM